MALPGARTAAVSRQSAALPEYMEVNRLMQCVVVEKQPL